MIVRHSRVVNIEFKGGEPPKEFCMIPRGTNASENGPYTYDDSSEKSVKDGYDRRGIDCMFDWHHASLDEHPVDPAEAIKAAGWYKLDFRPDGLWAVDISWTPLAIQKFADKEIRYFSPAFDADKSGRVVDFINCALTNLPATHNNEQLIAAARKPAKENDPMTEEERKEFERMKHSLKKFEEEDEARKEAAKREEESKREEARKAEAAKKAKKPAASDDDEDDEDEDDEDEEKRMAREDDEEESRRAESKLPKETEEEKKARRAEAKKAYESKTTKMSRRDLQRMVLSLHKENLQLRKGGAPSQGPDRETRVMSLIRKGSLSPSMKKFALSLNAEDFVDLERLHGGTRKETRYGVEPETNPEDNNSKRVKLARQIGKELGLTDEQIERGLKSTTAAKDDE